jgi:hypothetical protein
MYDTIGYYVEKVSFTDPVLNDEVWGYGVFSRETGVREAETRRLYTAKQLCNKFQADDDDALRVAVEREADVTLN